MRENRCTDDLYERAKPSPHEFKSARSDEKFRSVSRMVQVSRSDSTP